MYRNRYATSCGYGMQQALLWMEQTGLRLRQAAACTIWLGIPRRRSVYCRGLIAFRRPVQQGQHGQVRTRRCAEPCRSCPTVLPRGVQMSLQDWGDAAFDAQLLPPKLHRLPVLSVSLANKTAEPTETQKTKHTRSIYALRIQRAVILHGRKRAAKAVRDCHYVQNTTHEFVAVAIARDAVGEHARVNIHAVKESDCGDL
jgi:hypothetical protein